MKKTILSIIMAILIIVVPQTYCFANQTDDDSSMAINSTVPTVDLISNGFSVDKSTIYPNETFTLQFNLKNSSKEIDVKNVKLRLSGGDAFVVSNDVDSIYQDTIAKGQSATFSKSFYCNKSTEAGMYPISVSATYEYTADGQTNQGTAEFSYSVSVAKVETTTANEKSPSLLSTFKISKNVISNGENFKLSFNLKNTSNTTNISNVNIRLSGGDSFSVVKDVDTIYADSIAKGQTSSFSKTFYCAKDATSGMHPITVTVTYEYTQNGEKQQGSAEFSYSVNVATKATTTTTASAKLTPQLLISDFTYGNKEINGGETFNLSFTLKNTSSTTKAQNIIVKLSGGENFVVADGTDTLSINSLEAGKSTTITKSFKCLSSVPSGVYQVSASVSYEYIEDSAKQSSSTDLTMSIPVVQPDKVQFQSIDLADKTITVDEETDCAFAIVNTGQTKLSNGTVKLLDEKGNEIASAFIGNIEAGTQFSSNYTLPVTFNEEGSKKLKLVFEYENENMEKKSIEQEFNVTVEEYVDPWENVNDDANNGDTSDSAKSKLPIFIGIGAGVIVLIILAIVIKKIVKKRKLKKGSESFDEEI